MSGKDATALWQAWCVLEAKQRELAPPAMRQLFKRAIECNPRSRCVWCTRSRAVWQCVGAFVLGGLLCCAWGSAPHARHRVQPGPTVHVARVVPRVWRAWCHAVCCVAWCRVRRHIGGLLCWGGDTWEGYIEVIILR